MNEPHDKLRTYRSNRGFTLVELMVVVVVLALLASIAAPSYRSFVTTTRVKSAANDIWSALTMTRSEAIKRNNLVTITPNGPTWQSGWTVTTMVPPAPGATGGATQQALVQQPPLNAGVAITCYTGTSAASPCPAIQYNYSGRLAVGTAKQSIQIADAAAANPAGSPATRCVFIDPSGRPYSKNGGCQ